MRSYIIGASAVAIALAAPPASAASEEEYVSKAEMKSLYQSELPTMEGKEMIVREFTLPPGYVGGRHQHPGPVFVYVLEGELTIETESGTQTFQAGELYPEPLNAAMQAQNVSTSEPTRLLVFQVGDVGKPMMLKVE